MKHLGRITASSEQLKLFSANQSGAELIRGSAGSGKTTTALLRLTSLANMLRARKDRVEDDSPVRVLLLTFNRTLAGYVRDLAEFQVIDQSHHIEICTFAKWAMNNTGVTKISANCRTTLKQLASGFSGLDASYVDQEAEYLLGRFEPDNLEKYINTERSGRGVKPRVGAGLRRKILDEVVYPYLQYLDDEKLVDWNLLAIKMRHEVSCLGYDIAIVDESQDFSANQIRAIKHHLADDHSATFVIDTAQRIYARGFTWVEAGIDVTGNRSHRLHETIETRRKSLLLHLVSCKAFLWIPTVFYLT
ncbi:UvrD-helicase domain-containing protein [Pseudovibrio sp. Tun.PSC04-5.I4]|uniref:UvrD-helicase domain-containing protein n=1 Tax=Pseudovibrio sp. Tun.PSC04-5.I4 TaxID=1798213 RepID=UPI000AC600B7|nr:UvrD-helicase domain-containing protein [Pseudovibrio sp. Tun.PSC04-5.I4]